MTQLDYPMPLLTPPSQDGWRDFGRFIDEKRQQMPQTGNQHNSKAAVLIPILCSSLKAPEALLLTCRGSLRHHPHQVAFPGGRYEPQDKQLVVTALREAQEEIGLMPDCGEVIAVLPETGVMTGFVITPVLALVHEVTRLRADGVEVVEIFSLPLHLALNRHCYQIRRHCVADFSLRSLTLPYQHYDIWGLTAKILYRLAGLWQLYGRTTKVTYE